MPRRGRPSTLIITLTEPERRTLEDWQHAPIVSALQARRARLVLAVAGGATITTAARLEGMNRHIVRRWLARWQAGGVKALLGKPRGNPTLAAARAARKVGRAPRDARPC